MNVNQVLDALFDDRDDVDHATVYIEPPSDQGETDGDSADEDAMTVMAENLSGKQLRAAASAKVNCACVTPWLTIFCRWLLPSMRRRKGAIRMRTDPHHHQSEGAKAKGLNRTFPGSTEI